MLDCRTTRALLYATVLATGCSADRLTSAAPAAAADDQQAASPAALNKTADTIFVGDTVRYTLTGSSVGPGVAYTWKADTARLAVSPLGTRVGATTVTVVGRRAGSSAWVGVIPQVQPYPYAAVAIVVRDRPSPPAAAGASPLVSGLAAGTCVSVGTGGQGAPAVLATCSGTADQAFVWHDTAAVTTSAGLCLDAAGGRGSDGDVVISWPCNGRANQRWSLAADGRVQGINGKCLDVADAGAVAGAALRIEPCTGARNQAWQYGAPTPVAPVGPQGAWALTFADEFAGTALDTTHWQTQYPWGRTKGSELQYHASDDVAVSGGALHLTLRRRAMGGKAYTAGMVASWDKFTATPGTVLEMRARMPAGQGLWPAFWLLPPGGVWPPELDVVEVLGRDPTAAYMTAHWGTSEADHHSSAYVSNGRDLSAGWHTYTMQWDSTAIVWYLDGVETGRFTNAAAIPRGPMYVLANLALGGNEWVGWPDATTPATASFDVDYIRAWRRP